MITFIQNEKNYIIHLKLINKLQEHTYSVNINTVYLKGVSLTKPWIKSIIKFKILKLPVSDYILFIYVSALVIVMQVKSKNVCVLHT